MELAYRFIIYILIANIGYMIFSLFKRGFRHYSGYISQLFFLLCLMIVLVARDISGSVALSVSLTGIFILVLLPIFLQRRIDALMAENRIDEIEPYARWKANLAWSELNAHMHEIARLASEFSSDNNRLEAEIRSLLSRGEPYDSMTRIFLGLIHFNNRNFEAIINDLREQDRHFAEHSFEELLYLVRAFLETTRYEEAVKAQIVLESKINEGDDASPDKHANLVISRMIFLAFLGWIDEFEKLMSRQDMGIFRLPEPLRVFWRGVCLFNSGRYEEGEKIMAEVMKGLADEDEEDAMLPFMRKRFFSLVENREFFDRRVLPQLKSLHEKHAEELVTIIGSEENAAAVNVYKETASSILGWLTMVVSATLMMVYNVEDVIDLVKIGANSSFLVSNGEYFRLFTYQFVHIGWVHLLMNLVALKFFGPPIETVAGWPIFLGIYFTCGVVGGLAAVYAGQPLSAGASAAVLGLLSAAIIFELFKVKGSEKLASRNNFSTLIFILIINLVIGAVEKIVDNSAHLGGLAAGAALAFALIPVMNSNILKRLAGFFSVWFCVFLGLFSLLQMYNLDSQNFYPAGVSQFKQCRNSISGLNFAIPESWQLEPESETATGMTVVGPFKEKLTVLLAGNSDEPAEKIMLEYVNQRTREIEESSDVMLNSTRGPELVASATRPTYRVRWQITAGGGPMSVVDYLVFDDKILYLFRYFIGTAKDEAYNEIMNRSVSTLSLN